jgi:hypothetical protein
MTDAIGILSDLNPYARRVAMHLFRQFPDWTAFATIDSHPNADAGSLKLEVPSGSPKQGVLHISTDGDELTIGFHTHHCHFTDYDQLGTDSHIQDGIEYLGKLIVEEFVIHSWYCHGQFCGSVTGTPNEVGDPAKFIPNVDQITCRSWAGTHDCDDVKVTR